MPPPRLTARSTIQTSITAACAAVTVGLVVVIMVRVMDTDAAASKAVAGANPITMSSSASPVGGNRSKGTVYQAGINAPPFTGTGIDTGATDAPATKNNPPKSEHAPVVELAYALLKCNLLNANNTSNGRNSADTPSPILTHALAFDPSNGANNQQSQSSDKPLVMPDCNKVRQQTTNKVFEHNLDQAAKAGYAPAIVLQARQKMAGIVQELSYSPGSTVETRALAIEAETQTISNLNNAMAQGSMEAIHALRDVYDYSPRSVDLVRYLAYKYVSEVGCNPDAAQNATNWPGYIDSSVNPPTPLLNPRQTGEYKEMVAYIISKCAGKGG